MRISRSLSQAACPCDAARGILETRRRSSAAAASRGSSFAVLLAGLCFLGLRPAQRAAPCHSDVVLFESTRFHLPRG